MKNRRLSIKLTDYELQQLKEEAIRRGMTQSELLRSLIARATHPIFQGGLAFHWLFHPRPEGTGLSDLHLVNLTGCVTERTTLTPQK